MQVICVSTGSCTRGKELAEALASKLGARCLGRTDLVEEATRRGISVGKLEALVLKPNRFTERLSLEKEHYGAFATAFLCDHALEGDVVYHGRTGHLLLPGVSHVLRIRVVEDLERRIATAMGSMRLSRDKAKRFIQEVDDDTRRWVKMFYGVDWETTHHYDFVVNLDHVSVPNAAAALCTVATLPDFRETPASRQAMEDLRLASRVRLALAEDDRTRRAAFRAVADRGAVLVTYQPRDAGVVESVPAVAGGVEGVASLRTTMASTNILWIQERYEAGAETYGHLVELAKRWNAAVDLLRFVCRADDAGAGESAPFEPRADLPPAGGAYNGGIEDDVEERETGEDGGLRETHDMLARDGVAGGVRTVCCRSRRMFDASDAGASYTLVVIGDVFLDHDKSARVRMTRELAATLSETLKVPAVGVEELKKNYMVTRQQAFRLVTYLALTAGIVALVLTHQEFVLRFTHADGTWPKVLAAVGVAVLVPAFAFLYGTLTKNLLRLIRIE